MSADTHIEGVTEVNMALDGLIAALSPAGRRKLGLKLGFFARRINIKRIAAGVSPDGTPFVPKKVQKQEAEKRRTFLYKKKGSDQEKYYDVTSIGHDGKVFTGWSNTSGGIRTFVKKKVRTISMTPGGKKNRKPKFRKLFQKLRVAKNLRFTVTKDAVTLTFSPEEKARIAAVHHFGLRDKVSTKRKNSPTYTYPKRPLLGFSSKDMDAIKDLIYEHVEKEFG